MGRLRALIAGLSVAVLVVGVSIARAPRVFGEAGTKDFVEYWAAYHVASGGGNPYAPSQLVEVERSVGRRNPVPLMMWNPPWLLVIMRPALQASFGVGASRWMGINVALVALSVLLVASAYRKEALEPADLVSASIGGVLSVPMFTTLRLGQVSLLLLAGVSALYWALRHRHDLTAGAALALLSVKPHLFFLVFVLVAVVVLRESRWRIVVGAGVAMVALCVATLQHAPHSLRDWVDTMATSPSGAPAALAWRTPTFPNFLRELIAAPGGAEPTWPLIVVPAVAAIVVAIWLWQESRAPQAPVAALLPPVLCLSVFLAPFGWTFDHVVLTVPQVIILLRAFAPHVAPVGRWLLVAAVVLCHVALVVQSELTANDYSGFWWFAAVMLGVWALSSVVAQPTPPRSTERASAGRGEA